MSLNYVFSFFVYLKVKDLKRQLKLERKRAEQLQQKLQEALSENRVKPGMFFFLSLTIASSAVQNWSKKKCWG